ncbi:hypothetical protein T552_03350 [Pneumocystis carinii B80]|uniref:Ubiquitin carboxyl-terminal hydrolase n=1 Tax=Pneumocystis carinii (strain B80) TaxID=1408658 RepID=A0A0W4ZBG7_PNEC8|nr:hypothetical protein T552_03350 [Pneumocystis carinii B80]KTW25737.1 hypothetical protein T552_03350 [Pneumocystis carinii B80]
MGSEQGEPGPGDTLEVLRRKAAITEKSAKYPIKLWVSTARKLYDQAFSCEGEMQLEMAYVKYLRASSIVIEVIPGHKDYVSFKSRAGPVLRQYQELKQETSSSFFRFQKIHQILKLRDIEKMTLDKSNMMVNMKETFPNFSSEHVSPELIQRDKNSGLNYNFSLNEKIDFPRNDSMEISEIRRTQSINMQDSQFRQPVPCFKFSPTNSDLKPSFLETGNKDMNPFTSGNLLTDLNKKQVPSDQMAIFPNFSFIDSDTLYKYIISKDNKSRILFLDIRPRSEFNKFRIASENIVCIEPIILTLQEDISGDQLEESLIISPSLEQKTFSNRHKFDFIVYYDWDSKNDNLNGNIFQKEKARIFHNLNKAIYNYGGFQKPLKHIPMLLSGGLKEWINFIKKNDIFCDFIIGTNTHNIRDDFTENRLPLNHESNRSFLKSNINIPNSYAPSDYSLYNVDIGLEKKNLKDSVEMTVSMGKFQSMFKNNMNLTDKNTDISSGSNDELHSKIKEKYPSHFALSQQSSTKFTPYFETNNIHSSLRDHHSIDTYENRSQKMPANDLNNFEKKGISPNNPFYDYIKPKNTNNEFPQYSTSREYNSLDSYKFKQHSLSDTSAITTKPQALTSQIYNTEQFCIRGIIGATGLTNLGNTCYMNAIIQCLNSTIPFVRYYRDGSYKKHINFNNPLGYKGELVQTFARLITYLWDNEHTYVSPLFFKNVVGRLKEQFRDNDQQDSQEFLAFLLDGLHEELNIAAGQLKPKELTPEEELKIENMPDKIASSIEWQRYVRLNNSIVVSLFQGQLQSRLKCLTCDFQSTTYNPFTYLSLPIPLTQTKTSTLYECLQFFVQKEYLKDKEQWYCSKCRKPRDATKTLTISKIPQILLIHLKRFQTCGHWKDKINTKIDFLINNFDLTDFLLDSTQSLSDPLNHGQYLYHLYAVTNHYGNLDGGHYTAMVKNSFTNSWNLFDDRRVVYCNERDVVSSAAYILFYIRNNVI